MKSIGKEVEIFCWGGTFNLYFGYLKLKYWKELQKKS